MVRLLKFSAALLIAFGIAAEFGWIRIYHPRLEDVYQMLLNGIKMILYLFFP